MIAIRLTASAMAAAPLFGWMLATASPVYSPAPANEALLVEGGYAGFLDAHPDLRHHRHALDAWLEGDHATALRHFRKAARYADKPSQALIAEMLWEGQGVPRDRALAYAWMDLAAERGSERFLIQRERYWNELDAAQRTDAVARGAELYAEFGDDVAKPRMARAMARVSRKIAGSRTGFGGNTVIHAAAVGSGAAAVTTGVKGGDTGFQPSHSLPAVAFLAPHFWDPQQYFGWRDGYWERKLETGYVEVGEVAQARDASSDARESDQAD